MVKLQVNVKDLSTYRTQLMGFATLMIIACHASASGVVLPRIVSYVFTLGNYGVGIFLLLSGLVVFYSLSNKPVNTLQGWGKLL